MRTAAVEQRPPGIRQKPAGWLERARAGIGWPELGIFLLLLLLTDALFIGLYLLWRGGQAVSILDVLPDGAYDLEEDGSPSEIFEYVKEYWIAVMFVLIAFLRSERSYLAWAAVFVYILLDDVLQVHEQLGTRIAELLPTGGLLGLHVQDAGELLAAAMIGGVLLIALALADAWGSAESRVVSRQVGVLLALLVVIAVLLDAVHSLIGNLYASTIVATLEDGGELVVMSLVCWYVLRVVLYATRSTPAEDTVPKLVPLPAPVYRLSLASLRGRRRNAATST